MTVTITGIGSLPHIDPAAAARFVLASTDVPYLPQLPGRHPQERMLAQWGDGLAGCGADPGGIGLRYGAPAGPRHEAFAGSAAMLAALPTDTPRLKTQATGPVTLAMGFLAAGHPGSGLWDDVIEGLLGRIAAHLVSIRARLPVAEIMVLLDEPALSGLGDPGFPIAREDAGRALGRVLAGIAAETGVHCCAGTDWGLVADLRPDWISWDAGALGLDFAEGSDALAQAIAAGTRIIWGVVPAGFPPLPATEDLIGRMRKAQGILLMAGAPAAALDDDLWLSASCGLAGLSIDQADHVAEAVRRLRSEVHASH